MEPLTFTGSVGYWISKILYLSIPTHNLTVLLIVTHKSTHSVWKLISILGCNSNTWPQVLKLRSVCVCVCVCVRQRERSRVRVGCLSCRQLDRPHLWQVSSCVLSVTPKWALPIIRRADGTTHLPTSPASQTRHTSMHKHLASRLEVGLCGNTATHTYSRWSYILISNNLEMSLSLSATHTHTPT